MAKISRAKMGVGKKLTYADIAMVMSDIGYQYDGRGYFYKDDLVCYVDRVVAFPIWREHKIEFHNGYRLQPWIDNCWEDFFPESKKEVKAIMMIMEWK